MTDRLAAAQTALNAGRADEAIQHLIAALEENPSRPAAVYRTLGLQLYNAGRYAEGLEVTLDGARRHPRDFELLNIQGVLLRNLKRQPEAIKALEAAHKLSPKSQSVAINLGNVLLDLGEAARAETVFAKLARLDPRNPEHQRQLGRALLKQGKREAGFMRLRGALAIKKTFVDAWLDMAGTLVEEGRFEEALETLDRALTAVPGSSRLLEARVVCLRQSGQLRSAEAFLLELLPQMPNVPWVQFQLGTLIAEWDRERGNVHIRKALELDPDRLDYLMALIESLERTRTGNEGENIEQSYELAKRALAQGHRFNPSQAKIAREVFQRVADYKCMAEVGGLKDLGRGWANSGRHTAFLKQLPLIRCDEDRRELIEQHRIWGQDAERKARSQPIRRPPPRKRSGKIRLGLMSSDLRQHPVGYFALPLFEHIDANRFDVFVYSYYQGQADRIQDYITSRIEAYRWWPDISARDAAQNIAEDSLDLLIELGGSTHMNKLEVMAYKPAPLQASWLGYPHSAGLSTIDYLLLDPYVRPADPSFMLEKPMLMPKSWIALGKLAFPETHAIEPIAPHRRRGFMTFGTANNTYKYTPESLEAWASIVASTPDSHFCFIRPECTSVSFRNNVARYFADAGVSRDRLEWIAVRGSHMQHYNAIDIALDTFPQTGGTTTCEALWMGVPTISLVGPMFHERLSYSILTNAGLGDLCAATPQEYVTKAIALAGDRDRVAELRGSLRETLKVSPLGQTDRFARDFYDLVAATVAAGPSAAR